MIGGYPLLITVRRVATATQDQRNRDQTNDGC